MKIRKIMTYMLVFFLCAIPPIFGSETDKLIDQAIMYERQGRLDQAIETYRQILEIDPSNVMVQVRLAKVLGWKQRFEEALELLNQVLEKYPGHSEALFRKAQILSWQKKYTQSIETYRKYLNVEKNDSDALMGIARVSFWAGNNQEAISY
ncbi:MAG: tetratricopeptide repeat protein, partial [Spirochaetota bacterium]